MGEYVFKYMFKTTPNPNALKLVVNRDLKLEGRASFASADECSSIPMANSLLKLLELKQIHFFKNTMTLTKGVESDWDGLREKVLEIVRGSILEHNPEFKSLVEEEKEIPEEWKEFDAILDRYIRASLQSDGGDIRIVSYNGDIDELTLLYEGACTHCPSSLGTLNAIEQILQERLKREIKVVVLEEGV